MSAPLGRPNIVLIVTDQERAPMYWPDGFVEERMPSRSRLMRHGVSFENATCNTAMCSPSRATFLTGTMPAQHRVTDTLTTQGPFAPTETVLDPSLPNLASMLRAGGYDVHYRGKWHLSKGETGGLDATPEDLAAYGFAGWVPPDAGGDVETANFGGGRADHDAGYVEQATAFLRERAAGDADRPFCLVLSLVNPHDVLAFPKDWEDDYTAADLEGPVELPPTVSEDLAANFKPTAHAILQRVLNMVVGDLAPEDQRRYANFYANLTAKIDEQLAPVVDCLYDADGVPTALGEQTVVFRFSDHGELGMSHGGLRQKAFNVYEESIRVPLIVSNPRLVEQGRTCPHSASLIDLMPTIASLTGVEPPAGLRGRDLSPMILDADAPPVQDEVLFTFDDQRAGSGWVREVVPAAGRIRCLRERRWKYARYFHADGSFPPEHELYDLQEDPQERENLAHPGHPRFDEPAVVAERRRLAARLAELEDALARPVA